MDDIFAVVAAAFVAVKLYAADAAYVLVVAHSKRLGPEMDGVFAVVAGAAAYVD